jgi:hypothetical protein
MKEYYKSDMDIGLQILAQLQVAELNSMLISIFHIKGHQDKNTKVEKLSRPAQLNVKADELATEASKQDYIPDYYKFPASKVNIYINNIAITSNTSNIWRRAHLSQDFREYITKRHKWKINTAAKIWWKIIGVALEKFSFNDQIRIQKVMFDRLPTNHHANKLDAEVEDKCKDCEMLIEDVNHVFKCKSAKRVAIRETIL